jgi:hypothetical protein
MRNSTRFIAFLLSVLLMSSVCALTSAADYSICYNNTASADTSANVSGTGLLTISNRFTGFPSITTHAVITTYVEKRFLGLFWIRVDIGQTDNEWVDIIYDYTYVGGHTFQLTSTGTYRVTAVFNICGSGGPPDVITCRSTVVY